MLPVFVATRLRIDPLEKKSKRREFARWCEECRLCCLQADIIAMACPLLTYYSGNAAAKFAKKIRLR